VHGAENLFRRPFDSKPGLNALTLNGLPGQYLQADEFTTPAVAAGLVLAQAYRLSDGRFRPGGVDSMSQVRDGRLVWTHPGSGRTGLALRR